MTSAESEIIVALLGWWLVLATAAATLRHRNQDPSVLPSWIFLVCFALAVSFEVDPIMLWLDTNTGVNNLAWHCSSVSIIIGAYFISTTAYLSARRSVPWQWKGAMVLSVLGTTLLFSVQLHALPFTLIHFTPRTNIELAYMLVVYGFTVVAGGMVAQNWRRTTRGSPFPFALRATVLYIACCAGIFQFLFRFFYAIGAWFSPHLFWTQIAFIHPLARGIMGSFLVLGLLPQRFYDVVFTIANNTHQYMRLRHYLWLQRQVMPFFTPLVQDKSSFWDQWRNPIYHQYRISIYLLDSQKTLAIHPHPRAQYLYNMLVEGGVIRSHLTPEELILQCYRLSQRLRHQGQSLLVEMN